MPQEIDVWYVLPALRKEIAKAWIKKHKLKQKECAKIFGITEAAVSQYMTSKRADEISFSKEELKIIKEYADKIIKDKKSVHKHLYALCRKVHATGNICKLHRKKDGEVPHKCDLCMK